MKRNGDGATAGRYDRPMTPFADISRSRVARYLQLAELFRNRVNSGEWPVNGRIPNVEDLARECGVARGTIREAIGVLVDEGIIETFRAKGTFVRKSPQASRTHHLETDWRSIIETHEGVEIRVLEQKRVTALPAHALAEGTPARAYQMMRRVHLREGHPYLLARLYLEWSLYRKGPPRRFLREPSLPILHQIAGDRIAQARQVLTVQTADIEVAELLDLPLNAPVVHVRRTALDKGGQLLYLGVGLYRGDMVRLEINLR